MVNSVSRKKSGQRGKGKKQKPVLENPCRVCELSGTSYCVCPGEVDTQAGSVTPDPKVENRSVYSRLRVLIEGYDRHHAVSPYHCEQVYPAGLYDKWVYKANELEAIL